MEQVVAIAGYALIASLAGGLWGLLFFFVVVLLYEINPPARHPLLVTEVARIAAVVCLLFSPLMRLTYLNRQED